MTMQMMSRSKAVVEWNDTQYRILLTGPETDGRIGMWESICVPNGGPPRHRHEREDETFCVLEGEMDFWLEGTTASRKAGEGFHVPCGREHTFVVAGSKPARFLAVVTPGGFEAFFQDVASRGLRIPQDLSAVGKLSAQYGMIISGPPLRAHL